MQSSRFLTGAAIRQYSIGLAELSRTGAQPIPSIFLNKGYDVFPGKIIPASQNAEQSTSAAGGKSFAYSELNFSPSDAGYHSASTNPTKSSTFSTSSLLGNHVFFRQ